MKFTRQAANRARRLGITASEVESLIQQADETDSDTRGNLRYVAEIRGVRVRIVVAKDEPNVIITVHERRK